MEMDLYCKHCGEFQVTYITAEDLLDQVAEHLMLMHGVVDWKVENSNTIPEDGDQDSTIT